MAKGRVIIDDARCKGCGLCVQFCPQSVLELDARTLNTKGYHPAYAANPDACVGCGICGLMCPDVVITVERGDG